MDKVKLKAGTLKRIHVNVNSIRTNAKSDKKLPICRVQDDTQKGAIYGDKVDILGESSLVYSPDCPLACGAKVWVETHAAVLIHDVRPYDVEAQA